VEKLFAAHSPHHQGESFMRSALDLLKLLRSAGSAISAQAALHSQLIQVEWEEEKNRLSQLLIFALLGLICAMCLLLSLSFLAIALSWDTAYRLHVLVALPVIYSLVLFWVWRRINVLLALSSRTFAATREEIAADLALIKSRL